MNASLNKVGKFVTNDNTSQTVDVEPSMRVARVLVVEDDLTYRPFWESVLKSCFAHFELDWETTEKGAENLLRHAFRRNKRYDLVVADVFLAGSETGIDLWSRYGEATDSFIFVSGLPFERFDSLMSLDYGYPVYLQKPLSADVCRETVNSLCEASTNHGGGA